MVLSLIKKTIKSIPLATNTYFSLHQAIRNFKANEQFRQDFLAFSNLYNQTNQRFQLDWKDRFPCLHDKTANTGFDRHYVYHTAWAARILSENKPDFHLDISSSLYFCSMVSAFIPVKFYDYRPPNLELSSLDLQQADLFNLPFPDQSIKSLSCMHVVEHIGLGRYGDNLDPNGDIKAIQELTRVLAPGGTLLFVVPVGKPKIAFNAHRIYSYEEIINNTSFSQLVLKEFTLIPDSQLDGGLIKNADPDMVARQNYACGCFWFYKN